MAEESARNQPQTQNQNQTQTKTQASEKPNSESDPKIVTGDSSPAVATPAPALPPPPAAPPNVPQSNNSIPPTLQTKNPGRYELILDNICYYFGVLLFDVI